MSNISNPPPPSKAYAPASKGLARIAIAAYDSPIVRVYNAEGSGAAFVSVDIHRSPVRCMTFNTAADCVVSALGHSELCVQRCVFQLYVFQRLCVSALCFGVVFRRRAETDGSIL